MNDPQMIEQIKKSALEAKAASKKADNGTDKNYLLGVYFGLLVALKVLGEDYRI